VMLQQTQVATTVLAVPRDDALTEGRRHRGQSYDPDFSGCRAAASRAWPRRSSDNP
jgi:hypothetical protein